MRLPFGDKIDHHYYEMSLREPAHLLGAKIADVTSIKVRPISHWPIQEDAEFQNAFMFQDEYVLVYQWLMVSSLQTIRELAGRPGKLILLRTGAGEPVLFAEHETGPEIVATLALATASVTLLREIVGLVREIFKGHI